MFYIFNVIALLPLRAGYRSSVGAARLRAAGWNSMYPLKGSKFPGNNSFVATRLLEHTGCALGKWYSANIDDDGKEVCIVVLFDLASRWKRGFSFLFFD